LLFGAVVVLVLVYINRAVLFESGMPLGVDVWGHLARVWYMAKVLGEGGAPPDWFPHWYNGTALIQYYPPGSTWALAPIQMITDDVEVTFRIFAGIAVLFAGVATYLILLRWATPQWAALAAISFAAAPQFTRILYFEGNIPRTFIYALMPIMLGLSLRLLETGNRKHFIWLIVIVVFSTHVHHHQTVLFFSTLAVGALVYLVNSDRDQRLNAIKLYAAWGAGIALGAWFIVPGVTHIDYANVPNVEFLAQAVERDNLSHLFNPKRGSVLIDDAYIGVILTVLAISVALVRRDRRTWTLTLMAISAIVLAHGLKTPVFKYYPVPGTVPVRFVETATLSLIFLAANFHDVLRLVKIRRTPLLNARRVYFIAMLAVVVLMVQDYSPYWSRTRVVDSRPLDGVVATFPEAQPGARIDVNLPSRAASTWFFKPIEDTGWRLPSGFSIETTPHQSTIFNFNSALRNNKSEFVARTFELWNVRASVTGADQIAVQNALLAAGFVQQDEDLGHTVLVSDEKSKPVMKFDRSMLGIGRGARGIAEEYPWASYSEAEYFDDLDFDYVERFDILFLWDFLWKDRDLVENKIAEWVESGKTVLIDMTRMPDPGIFGTSVVLAEMPGQPDMRPGRDADFEFTDPYSLDWADEGETWRGVTYRGLDGSILEFATVEGNIAPALGYKMVGDQKLYFLGLGWLIHASGKNDPVASDFLDSFFDRASPARDLSLPAVEITNFEPSSDNWGFDYTLERGGPVLVSETWSPHWRVRVDGTEIDVKVHENLMLLDLPSGDHSVRIDYGSTPVQWVSAGMTMFGLLVLAGIVIRWHQVTLWVRTVDQDIWNSELVQKVLVAGVEPPDKEAVDGEEAATASVHISSPVAVAEQAIEEVAEKSGAVESFETDAVVGDQPGTTTPDLAARDLKFNTPVVETEPAPQTKPRGSAKVKDVQAVVLRNGVRFDGEGSARTASVELQSGDKRMFMIGELGDSTSVEVLRNDELVAMFEIANAGEWFALEDLNRGVRFKITTAAGVKWSLYLETRRADSVTEA
jgi:hypothetical protein